MNTFRSQPRWLALVRFGLQYLGWRSTSLGLGELTPGSCGNAFGVNRIAELNHITTCENTAWKAMLRSRYAYELESEQLFRLNIEINY